MVDRETRPTFDIPVHVRCGERRSPKVQPPDQAGDWTRDLLVSSKILPTVSTSQTHRRPMLWMSVASSKFIRLCMGILSFTVITVNNEIKDLWFAWSVVFIFLNLLCGSADFKPFQRFSVPQFWLEIANLPIYLSSRIEHIQRRASGIMYPTLSYDDVLQTMCYTRLSVRRHNLCLKTFKTKTSNSKSKLAHLLPKKTARMPWEVIKEKQ